MLRDPTRNRVDSISHMAVPRVLVVGGGYAGVETARRLGKKAAVTIVSRENFLLFTPMLAEVAAGDIEPRHIVSPLRQLCPRAEILIGEVESVDMERRTVQYRPALSPVVRTVGADALIITVGSIPATFGVAGVGEETLGFKTMIDALRIRRRVVALLEAATDSHDPAHTTIAIIGAGYAGCELAAGLADFMHEAAPRYYPEAPRPRVLLVDAVDRVTPTLTERLSAAANRALLKRGVETHLGRRVTEVGRGWLTLDDGREITAGTIIWSAGVRANPLAGTSGVEHDKMGRLIVDGNMRAAPGVYALGDAAAVPDGHGAISPTTAQYALRQGKYLGRKLPALLAGKRVRSFRYRSRGQLVALGHRNAVGLVFGLPVSGFVAWFMWRSYYLLRLPTLLRKLRVAVDWALDLIFPPDVVELPSVDIGPALPNRTEDDPTS